MISCLAIFREPQNSPNRESDDALILRAVTDELRRQGLSARLRTPEEADREELSPWDLIVPMCESYPRLMRLKSLALAPEPPLIINRPEAVLNCYRTRMMKLLRDAPGVKLPETSIHSTAASIPLPAFAGRGAWLKRGDVHNTCACDVVFARDPAEVERVRGDFERREIAFLLLQRHVDGDLVKFYGVGPGQWFTWFYHDPHTARRLPFEPEDLSALAEAGAGSLGLEVFGGDAIISSEGPIYLIDINSWPSFARVRAEAAAQIARLCAGRLRSATGTQDRR